MGGEMRLLDPLVIRLEYEEMLRQVAAERLAEAADRRPGRRSGMASVVSSVIFALRGI